MLTHENIWTAIDRLAKAFGYSASGLAKQAGLDPTSFNKSKRLSPDGKPRWPSTESIAKVLAVTGATMSEFIGLLDDETNNGKLLMSMDRQELAKATAKILIETKSILFNAKEPFTLKSGRASPVYFDGRRLISFVKERSFLMDAGAKMLADEIGLDKIDLVAGGETAGIPYGAFNRFRYFKFNLAVILQQSAGPMPRTKRRNRCHRNDVRLQRQYRPTRRRVIGRAPHRRRNHHPVTNQLLNPHLTIHAHSDFRRIMRLP